MYRNVHSVTSTEDGKYVVCSHNGPNFHIYICDKQGTELSSFPLTFKNTSKKFGLLKTTVISSSVRRKKVKKLIYIALQPLVQQFGTRRFIEKT